MKTLEESVVLAMDGSNTDLFPFLPYIVQDLWEIGADPNAIIKLIRKHFQNYGDLNVLDLGCGKGVVSIKVSKAFGCRCHGIDAIPEFIAFAQLKADEWGVKHLCAFETGDIREKVNELSDYDLIILGAIGPVFGDYYKTLTTLSKCVKKEGLFIVDDGYIDDSSNFIHPVMFKKNILLQHIEKAGMELVENDIMNREDIKISDDYIFDNLKKRCCELIEKHPDKQNIFLDYIEKQEIENDILENKVIGTTMVIRKKAVA